MNDTDRLIERLAEGARPVHPLQSPLRRTAQWAAVMGLLVALIVTLHGPRPGLMHAMMVPGTGLEWLGSVATACLAAFAAFQVSVPGRSPMWAWLPVPGIVLWLGGLVIGCVSDAVHMGSAAFAWQGHVAECGHAIAMSSIPIGLAMLWMTRYAATSRPTPTATLAALSAAALSSAAVSLIHLGETSWMQFVWHVGAVALVALAGLVGGRHVLAALNRIGVR
ncbi:NrsF family protein [Lysobacter xanthus]